MRTRVFALLAATTAAIVAPTAASAATIVGTLAGAVFNVGSSTPVIGAGTTFTNSGTIATSNGTGDLSPISFFTPFNLSNVTATWGSAVTLSGAYGTFVGTITKLDLSTVGTSSVVSLYTLGTFTPSVALAGFDPGAASLTFSFTQTGGAGAAVSGSYTLASPPSGVPEPAAWGLLIAGAGMAGAAARRRRSVKVSYA